MLNGLFTTYNGFFTGDNTVDIYCSVYVDTCFYVYTDI